MVAITVWAIRMDEGEIGTRMYFIREGMIELKKIDDVLEILSDGM